VLPDQSALYGVLRQVHDLGLTLISVQRIELGQAGQATKDQTGSR